MKVMPVQIGCGVAPSGKGLAANGPAGHTPRVGEGLLASAGSSAPGAVLPPGVAVAPAPPGLAIPTTLGPSSEPGEPEPAPPLGDGACALIARAAPLPAAVALPCAPPEPPEGASPPAA